MGKHKGRVVVLGETADVESTVIGVERRVSLQLPADSLGVYGTYYNVYGTYYKQTATVADLRDLLAIAEGDLRDVNTATVEFFASGVVLSEKDEY